MIEGGNRTVEPTRARKVFATIVVAVTVLIVWKVIDHRSQPPPPPNPASSTP